MQEKNNKRGLLFFLIVIINLAVYFPCLYSFPQSFEQTFFVHTAGRETLGEMVSPQMAHLFVGETKAYQPFFYFFLCLEKTFFKYNFLLWHAAGFALHLAVLWCLLRLLLAWPYQQAINLFILGFSMLTVSHQMVTGVHLHGYLLALIFTLKIFEHFIHFLTSGYEQKSRIILIVLYLFVGYFLDEYFLLLTGILVAAIYLHYKYVFPRKDQATKRALRNTIAGMVLPLAVYLGIHFQSYLLRLTQGASRLSVSHMGQNLSETLLVGILGPALPLSWGLENTAKAVSLFDVNQWKMFFVFKEFSTFEAGVQWISFGLTAGLLVWFLFLQWNKKKIERSYADYQHMFFSLLTLSFLIGYVFILLTGQAQATRLFLLREGLQRFYILEALLVAVMYGIFAWNMNRYPDYFKAWRILFFIVVVFNVALNAWATYRDNVSLSRSTSMIKTEHEKAGAQEYYLAKKYYHQGINALWEGDRPAAFAAFNKAIEYNPYSSTFFNARGLLFAHAGEAQEGFNDFNKALRLDPSNFNALNNLGSIYKSLGKLDLAADYYSRSLSINPSHVEALVNRAIVYGEQQKYGLALKDLNEAVMLNPESISAYINRGLLYSLMKNYDKALEDYNKAIELNPRHALGYFNRSQTFRAMGKIEEALQDAFKAKSLGYAVPASYIVELLRLKNR